LGNDVCLSSEGRKILRGEGIIGEEKYYAYEVEVEKKMDRHIHALPIDWNSTKNLSILHA